MFFEIDSVHKNYKILELAGYGGYGQVYRVKNLENDKILALKVIRANQNLSYQREYQILKQVNDSNLIKLEDDVFSIGSSSDIICMPTEFCENGCLKNYIKATNDKKTKIDPDLVFDWTKQIVSGLKYLHYDKNIIHRDIKPGNILLTKENQIKIADFGLARFVDSKTLSLHKGTEYYMSPEMIANRIYDFKTDIWSTGCVLYELINLKKIQLLLEESNKDKTLKTTSKLANLLKLMLIRDRNKRISSKELMGKFTALENLNQETLINSEDFLNELVEKPVKEFKLPSSYIPSRQNIFVGREAVVSEIDVTFQAKKKFIIFLTSFAGTGKTSVALEYGYRFVENKPNNYVYWMKSDIKNLDLEYRNFAASLKIKVNATDKNETIIRQVNDVINNLDSNIKILFIFDNCDSYENVENYIKNININNQLNIFILITTRDSSLEEKLRQDKSHIIKLDPFSYDQSCEFAKKSLGERVKDENDVKDLIKLIGHESIRPYILRKFIATIQLKTEVKPLKKLIKEFKTIRKSDINKVFIEENEIFYLLIENYIDSWNILKYCAFLDPDFMPTDILTDILNIDEDTLSSSVEKLKKLSILSSEHRTLDVGLKLHRSFQDEIKTYLKAKNVKDYNDIINDYFNKLNKEFEGDFNEKRKKGRIRTVYYYNFNKIMDTILNETTADDIEKCKLLKKFADYLHDTDKFVKAIETYEKALRLVESIDHSDKNETIADILYSIGFVNNKLGKYDDAYDNYLKSKEIYQKISINNKYDVEISDILYGIAVIHRNRANYDDSVRSFEEALSLRKNKFKEDENSESAYMIAHYGSCLRNHGRYKEGLEKYLYSLSIFKKLNNDDESGDWRIAEILHGIGFIYRVQGKYDLALEHYQRSIAIKCDMYDGEQNTSIATTLQNSGTVFSDLREYDLSLEIYKKSLSIYEKIFKGGEHLNVGVSYTNLCYVYAKLEMYDVANQYLDKSISTFKKVLKNLSNPYYIDALSNKGLIYIQEEKYQEGLEICLSALDEFRKLYGHAPDFRIGDCLKNISFAYLKLNDFENSRKYLNDALDLFRTLFETDQNLRIAEIYHYFALGYKEENDSEKFNYYLSMAKNIEDNYLLRIKSKFYFDKIWASISSLNEEF